MSQLIRTDREIDKARACPTSSTGLNYMEAHARDLAKRLDAVSDIVFHPFHSVTLEDWQAIRAIIEADQ